MKNTLLFTTIIAGLALAGCNKSTRTSTVASDPTVTRPADTSTDTLGAKLDRTGDRVADASRNAADKVRDASHDAASAIRNAGQDLKVRYTEWRLSHSDLETDLNANRPIIRTSTAVAGAPTGTIDDGTIEKAIKGRFHSDAELANFKFDVNANKKGEVELEGKARTVDQIARAMAIALDTDGVTQVTSKIKLDADAGPNLR